MFCSTANAGKGASCALEIDNATQDSGYEWIRYEVYNPTDKAIIITGVKYFKGGEFWREYSDIYETVAYKRSAEFVHHARTNGKVSYVLQCHQREPEVYTPQKKKKSVKKTEENPVLVLIVVFAIIGYIIYKFSNSKEKKSNRKIAKENNVPDVEILSKDEIKEKYKIIAKFYNNYKIIDYGKISNKKIAQKQMEDIVNVVDKNLAILSAGTENTPYRMLIVGIVTFKLTTKEQVIKVHNDLKKMYKKGKLLEFDDRLMTALENILDDNAGIDY
tara:strand:- start:3528 stop:4349 length:822 start_codon:yes stop_codon:yes gene_type:complete